MQAEGARDVDGSGAPARRGNLAGSGPTAPEVFFERARRDRDRVALRRKRLGLWEELTWADYERAVRAVAAALAHAGVAPGEPVGLVSENRVEWLFSDLGILTAGAVTCALYTTSAPEQIEYIIRHAGVRVVIAENEEQLDKLLKIRDACGLRLIVVMEPKGLRHFEDPAVRLWSDFIAEGERLASGSESRSGSASGSASGEVVADAAEARWRSRRPDDLAILVYTSGTTGPPKGVMLSHRNVLWACTCLGSVVMPAADGSDEYLSFLPLCHVAERTITVFNQVLNGSVVSFAESLDTVSQNLAEVRPHVLFAVPRIWEKLYNAVELRMREASWAKRRAYAWALEIGRQVLGERRASHDRGEPDAPLPPALRARHLMADRAVLGPLREKLGLDRVRYALSGAAPISPDVVGWFQAVGVPLVEGYGMTETAAIVSVNMRGFPSPGTVGKPVPGLDVTIAEDGEIVVRSPGVMMGYFGDAAATADAIRDGWLHTGDVGELDSRGHLRITDRKKDLIINAYGKNIAPQYIESKLRKSPYVHDAVVIGDRRKYVTALVVLDEDNLVEWAQKSRVQFGAYADLARSEDVQKLVSREIDRVNAELTHVEGIKKFRILERRLDSGEGELTPTLKVRRKIVEEKYADVIEGMYRG